MKKEDLEKIGFAFLQLIALLFLSLLFAAFANAQTCLPTMYHKGDTVIAQCDSLILIPKQTLKSAIHFEQQKNASLIKLSLDKDRAVKELVESHKQVYINLQKQIEVLETAYTKVSTQYQATLMEAKVASEKTAWELKDLGVNLKAEKDARELERNAAKRLLWKQSLMFGGIGVGFGGILTTLIFVAR